MKQTHVAKKVANIYWGRDGKGLTQWGSNASRDFNRSDLLLSKFHERAFKSFNFTFHESEENTLINKLFKINNVAMMREIVSSALKQYFHSLRFTFSSLHSIYEYKLWFSIIFIDDFLISLCKTKLGAAKEMLACIKYSFGYVFV